MILFICLWSIAPSLECKLCREEFLFCPLFCCQHLEQYPAPSSICLLKTWKNLVSRRCKLWMHLRSFLPLPFSAHNLQHSFPAMMVIYTHFFPFVRGCSTFPLWVSGRHKAALKPACVVPMQYSTLIFPKTILVGFVHYTDEGHGAQGGRIICWRSPGCDKCS